MPYINTKTNIAISKEKEEQLKTRLGQAITLLGKTESWLMLEFEDQRRMYFRGEKETPMAFVEIRLFGKAKASMYEEMTKAVTAIIESELEISGEQIYVQYQEVDHWGYNGANF